MPEHKYARAASEDTPEDTAGLVNDTTEQYRQSAARKWSQYAILTLLVILSLVGSFQLGKHAALEPTSRAIDFDIVPHMYRYNRSFSEVPSNHTNRAWRELFPKEGGFFVHPTIAPKRATFHVFHTLHCLNHFRQAYWMNVHAAVHNYTLTDDDLPEDFKASHVRHCIDLIRQSLMCQADTTLEVVDESINGVHGFRTEHQCRNWEQLRDWTTEQQLRQHVPQIE